MILVLVLLVLSTPQAHQQCLSLDDVEPGNSSGTRALLYSSQQSFSFTLLQALNQLTPHENVLCSPYSTYNALLMAYFLSGGPTERYLKEILQLHDEQNKPTIYKGYKTETFLTRFSTHGFQAAYRIFLADDVLINNCFKELFQEEFSSIPTNSRDFINSWVRNHTDGMIVDLLPPGSVDQSTTLLLVNAAFFKNQWENKFDPRLTRAEVFYISTTKQLIVPMMQVTGVFNHGVSQRLEAHILEMNDSGQISMYVFLPAFSNSDPIDSLLKKLTLENFQEVVNSDLLKKRTVKVSFPKISLEKIIKLGSIFDGLAVGDLFKHDTDVLSIANIFNYDSHIVQLANGVYKSVGEGVHTAKIVINEEPVGSKNPASFNDTNVTIFKCNHPFVFIVYHKTTHNILFSGVFRK